MVQQNYRQIEVEKGSRSATTARLREALGQDTIVTAEEQQQALKADPTLNFDDVINQLYGGTLSNYGSLRFPTGQNTFMYKMGDGTTAPLNRETILNPENASPQEQQAAQEIFQRFSGEKFGEARIANVDTSTGIVTADKGTAAYKLASDRLNVKEILTTQGINNPLVQEVMIDQFNTGNFYHSAKDRLQELGRTPYYLTQLAALGYTAISPRVRSLLGYGDTKQLISENVRGREVLASDVQKMWEGSITRALGVSTREDGLNAFVHKEAKEYLIAKYGKEEGERIYNLPQQQGGMMHYDIETNKATPIRIFNSESADALFNYAFKQLPTEEKLGIILAENASISTLFANFAKNAAMKQAKKARELKKANPEKYANMSAREIMLSKKNENLTDSKLRDFFDKFRYSSANLGENELLQIDALAELNVDIADKASELAKMSVTSTDYLTKKRQLTNLVNRRTRMTFLSPKVRVSPILFGTLKTDLAVSLGQTAGATFHDSIGVSPETGEMIGALGTAVGLHKLITAPAKYAFRKADGLIDGSVENAFRNFGEFLEDLKFLPFIPPGMLTDRSLDEVNFYLKNLKLADGSPNPKYAGGLTLKQRRSFKLLTQLTERLSDEQKEDMIKAITEVSDLQKTIKDSFPKDQQNRAEEVFQTSFAMMSNMPALQAIEKLNIGKLTNFALARFDIGKVQDVVKAQERTLNKSMFAVRELRRRADEIGERDPKRADSLKELSNKIEQRHNSALESLEDRKTQYASLIDNYKRYITQDMSANIGSRQIGDGILEELFEFELEMKGLTNSIFKGEMEAQQALQGVVQPQGKKVKSELLLNPLQEEARKRELLNEFVTEVADDIEAVKKTLQGFELTPAGEIKIGMLNEKLYHLKLMKQRAKAKMGYIKYTKAAMKGNQPAQINISSDIVTFLKEQRKAAGQPLYKQFAVGGRFFAGRRGNEIGRVFGKIAKDSLNNFFERAAREGGEDKVASDVRKEVAEVLRKGHNIPADSPLTDIEIFMMLNDELPDSLKGKIPDDMEVTVNVDYFQMEEMNRHFKSVAQTRSRISKAEGRVIGNFAESLNGILERDAKLYPLLQEARDTYQTEWFDKIRPGGYSDKIEQGMSSERIETKLRKKSEEYNIADITDDQVLDPSTSTYSFPYKEGSDPTTWNKQFFDTLVENVTGGKKGDVRGAAGTRVVNQFQALHRFWSDGIVREDGSKIMGFDLTTKTGQRDFKDFQKILEEGLLDTFSKIRLPTLKGEIGEGGFPIFGVLPLEDLDVDKINEIASGLLVNVKTKNGDLAQVKILDIDKIINQERDITKIIVRNTQNIKIHKKLKDEHEQFRNKYLQQGLDKQFTADQGAISRLFKSIGLPEQITDSSKADFFEQAILRNPEGNIDSLVKILTGDVLDQRVFKDQKLAPTKKEIGASKKIQDITGPLPVEGGMTEDQARNLIANLITEGLFAYGNYGALEGRNMKMFDGKIGVPSGFQGDGISRLAKLFQRNVNDLEPESFDLNRIESNLRDAIGDEGFEITKKFVRLLSLDQAAAGIDQIRIEGLLRDITPNELVSRGFNLARGMVSPAYVAAEVYLRVASTNNIDIMKLAMTDPKAGDMLLALVKDPKGFNVRYDVRSLVSILGEFVSTELVRAGKDFGDLDQEALEALYYVNSSDLENRNEDL